MSGKIRCCQIQVVKTVDVICLFCHPVLFLSCRHVVFAPSSHNKYAGESFPGIYDALFDIENAAEPDRAWSEVKRQISIAAFTVNAAADTLHPVL